MPAMRADQSVSETAAVPGLREARGGRPGDQIPQLFVRDRRGEFSSLFGVLGGRMRSRRSGLVGSSRLRFGQRSRNETQAWRSKRAESFPDFAFELRELQCP